MRAAAWVAGADRWTEVMWRNLEQQVGAPPVRELEQAADGETAVAIARASVDGLERLSQAP
jgi:hypothetical protein